MFRNFLSWLNSKDGMFPWFEHNQGVLSVAALVLTLAALFWEFRQAKKAERDAKAAKVEAEVNALKAIADSEAKDRQALLTAKKKEREGRIIAERDEIASFCFVLDQTFETLRAAARVEIHRLEQAQTGELANSTKFIAEGYRVQRAVEAILARPPADQNSVLAACRGLEIFPSWKFLDSIYQPTSMIDAINGHMEVIADAQAKLLDARRWAANVAAQHLEEG